LFVVAARHEWTEDGDEYLVTLEGIGGDAVFRLEGRTPAPRIPGIDYAIVSGPPGDEVFADEDGCVRVRFLWDREAPSDETSSRPARVLQPNLAGSLLIPRVGWEVWVGFEDGDPERPVVLGRADNAKHPPALGLPENKTTTQIGTPSTPGAGTKQLLTFEDKAGKQGVSWLIGKGLTRTVANNMFTQTGGDETGFVGGAQLINVGTQKVSVKLASVSEMASQMLDITGTHDVSTGEAMHLKLGSETVACSSLIELVGDPANAVVDLVTTAAFAALGAKYSDGLGALVVVGGKAIVNGIKEGYTKGVVSGVVAAGKEVAGALPGVGDAFGFASDILEGAEMAPWQPGKHPWQLKEDEWKELEDKANEEFNAAAGGAGGGAAGPGDAGPGHRVTKVGGATLETIGGAYLIATPGGLKWTTLGMATYIVGGAHSTATARMSFLTAGASLISTGLFNVAAPAGIEKIAKVAYAGNIGGAHRTTAGKGAAFIAKGALSLTVDGALTHSGSKAIFKCGGSKVVIDGSGITMTAPKITYEDPVKASEASRG
jgi:type VI secretion system secreted protein VgrG